MTVARKLEGLTPPECDAKVGADMRKWRRRAGEFTSHCKDPAAYEVASANYCKRHAGAVALALLLKAGNDSQ